MATAPTSEAHSDPRLRVPFPPADFLARPRVVEVLDRAATRPIVVVTGPAGAGKTTAVAAWLRESAGIGPVAWVSLEPADADPAHFALSVQRAAGLPGVPETDLRAALGAALGPGGVLVLDDLGAPGTTPDLLEQLLRWPPDGLRIVVISREGPPPALHRQRISGGLGSVGSAELAFTRAECDRLVALQGIRHTPAAVTRLYDLTEGWPGPLVLVTRETGDLEQALLGTTPAGLSDPRSVLVGYLDHEVLGPLGGAARELLTRTCVAGELDVGLARRLAGRDDIGETYADLSARELLLPTASVGRQRQRPLVARALAARLQADRPALDRRLRRIATAWQEARHEPLTALTQAVRDADWEFVGEVSLRSSAPAILDADRGRLARLLDAVPPEEAFGRPELEIGRAIAAFSRRDGVAVRTLLARAEPDLAGLPEPRRAIAMMVARILEASQAYREGDAARMVRSATEAEALMTGLSVDEAPGWAHNRGIPHSLVAVGEIWAGRPTRAVDLLTESLVGYPPTTMSDYASVYYSAQLAVAEAGAGLFARARRSGRECLDLAGAGQGHETQGAWLALAMDALVRADPRAAREATARGRAAAGQQMHPPIGATLHLIDAWSALQQRDLPTARQHLRTADAALVRHPGIITVAQGALATRIYLELAAGAVPAAGSVEDTWLREAGGTADTGAPTTDLLLVARSELALATGRPGPARELVSPLLEREGLYGSLAWLNLSRALDAERQDFRAIDAMARSLDLAAADDLAHPYVHPDRRLKAALTRHLTVVGSHRELVERALGAGAPIGEDPRAYEQLTDRELSVLAYLPTMQSNAEIARALSISENTVKQHLKVVYRKLGVRSRREAVRVANTLGLLPG